MAVRIVGQTQTLAKRIVTVSLGIHGVGKILFHGRATSLRVGGFEVERGYRSYLEKHREENE